MFFLQERWLRRSVIWGGRIGTTMGPGGVRHIVSVAPPGKELSEARRHSGKGLEKRGCSTGEKKLSPPEVPPLGRSGVGRSEASIQITCAPFMGALGESSLSQSFENGDKAAPASLEIRQWRSYLLLPRKRRRVPLRSRLSPLRHLELS